MVLTTSILVLLAMAYTYKEKHRYKCRLCQSLSYRIRWAVGNRKGASVTIWSRETIRQSNIYRILFDEEHSHDWEFAYGVRPSLLGVLQKASLHASVGAQMNRFARSYESTPLFREFIDKQIEQGILTLDQLYQILALSYESYEGKETDANILELVHLAKQLVIEGETEEMQKGKPPVPLFHSVPQNITDIPLDTME